MAVGELSFTRDYDLPPVIVWDGLVDDVLVGGWLAPARIEPRVGGRCDFVWPRLSGLGADHGSVTELKRNRLLAVRTYAVGGIRFELEELPTGPRGASTRLTMTVAPPETPAPVTVAYWSAALEALNDLLHGHPVDWAHWERDYGDLLRTRGA